MSNYKIKICGVTNPEDAGTAADAGVDFIGCICDIAYSPRTIDPLMARAIRNSIDVPLVLLTDRESVDDMAELVEAVDPYAVQLYGFWNPAQTAMLKERIDCKIWKPMQLQVGKSLEAGEKVFREKMKAFAGVGAEVIILDAVDLSEGFVREGGTGKPFNWEDARGLIHDAPCPVMVAGGLNAENVCEMLQLLNPWGLDVSSGVEEEPGIKSPELVRELVSLTRSFCF